MKIINFVYMAHIFTETERLILREWKRSDRTDFAQMNCDEEVMKYFPSVLSQEESDAFVDRIEAEINENGYGLFAVELKATGKFIGYVGFHKFSFDMPFSPGWEIGWRLEKRYWHKGYATEAAKACLEYAREQGLFNCLYSFTSKPNTTSENVMKKIGMVYQGNFFHPALPDQHWLKEHLLYRIDL